MNEACKAGAAGGVGPAATVFSAGRVARALRHSCIGLRSAWRDEAAFRQELLLTALVVPLTLWLELPRLETVLLLALLAAVLVAELLNSGLEAIVDKVVPEFDLLAGKAKDCGSAAVLVALVSFALAWLVLAGPALWARLAAAP